MSRPTIYAICASFLFFFAWGCLEADTSNEGSNGTTEDAGQDIREHPSQDVISGWDVTETSTEEDPTISGEICDNGQDDDGDFMADCYDTDCADFPDCQEAEVEVDCDNGDDDDDDGRADCDDTDCASAPNCTGPIGDEVCDNGQDDDADGMTDCYDGDCALDDACRATTAEDCFNGIDDDSDGLTDCDDTTDCETACSGGSGGTEEDMLLCMIMCMMDPDMMTCIENCMGGGGMGGGETDCANGIDDNSDGMTDCEDMYCMMDPACQ